MRTTLRRWLLAAAFLAETAGAEPITFGVQLAPEGTTIEELRDTFRFIEELGYDHVWLNDHFIPSQRDRDEPHFESWILLAALARETRSIRLGILVSGNTYRHPAVLAKMATTLDHVSDGRLNFGIGAGWEEFEHRAYGIPFYDAKERAGRLGEALELVRRLWTEDHPTWKGRYYALVEAPFSPKPIQKPHPPIVVGGQGRKWILPIVARYADEWNVPVGIGPEDLRDRLAIVRAECRKAGRSPCVRQVSVFLPVANISDVPLAGPVTRLGARLLYGAHISRSVLAGSAEDIRARIREYVEAGATSIIITTRPGIDRERLRRFREEVMVGFRESSARDAGRERDSPNDGL